MIKIQGYDIYFRHKSTEEGYTTNTVNDREVKSPFVGVTECIVEKDKEVVVKGIAYCSPIDKYVKSAGRKVALGKAIATFDKQFRKEIWEAYIKETSRL